MLFNGTEPVVFIVDLNELENDNELPVSMDYTTTYGAGIFNSMLAKPAKNDWVSVYSEDDSVLYSARVTRILAGTELVVEVDWNSRVHVVNEEWNVNQDATNSIPDVNKDGNVAENTIGFGRRDENDLANMLTRS